MGLFRLDLYARLAGAVIRLSPLRHRREDIPVLARHFLSSFQAGAVPIFTAGFVELLVTQRWPMNVRELRTAIQRLALAEPGVAELRTAHLASVLDLRAVPAPPVSSPRDSEPLGRSTDKDLEAAEVEVARMRRVSERQRILDALEQCQGNQTRAAVLLGISRRTLVSRLNEHDVPRPRKR